ncbi:MLO-like protein 6 [Andrographis paniculata]|uniref:MLO-like protein 6 n=1 Tax=Andrographis paniculata TaxID=175694 RepID=UPI0021E7D8F1|nr:MLO-like protein 6 [Andrographis paniculata]
MAGKERTLEATPTWAVAVVCFVLVAISILIEQLIHRMGSWLKKKKKPSLYDALEKIKAELMLLGFISLLLTLVQSPLSDICVPKSVGHSWHPCPERKEDEFDDPCLKKGKVQVVSAYGIHQLHIFIFVLAVAHVLYCVVTYGLGKLKMRKWRSWEDETKTIEYQYYNDPERFRFARDTSFGRRHLHFWSKSPVLLWIVCFFRQFLRSVAKVDYLTLRHGFITAHLAPHSQESFNFHKYINKSLEEDFKVVAGISPIIWLCAVLLLLTNTNGWYSLYWLPFIPLIIILLVGAKLQVIITKMGIRILERGDVIKGTPVVQPGDDLFWFNRPGLILFLIHFVLFQNAFQLAFFAWSWYEFDYPSCYHENIEDIIIRIAMGILIQFLCSYVTLPLYALVTQMGSNMKPVIFSDQVASALRGWHQMAKKHMKQGRHSASTTPFSSRPPSPLHGSMSPVYLLRGHKIHNDNTSVDGIGYNPHAVSPRASSFSNDGDRTSVSPRHRETPPDNYETNSSLYPSEMDKDFEDRPESSNRGQHEVRISLDDFSFRKKGSVGEARAGAAGRSM